ncbi:MULTISPECIES: AIPR family protein [unclassified Streptomyces]|uniref:AIPR family protein n=1 Tax=unclassified Streptomyces TaxID=2593676 RepID=UPI001F185855|nr:MULTISPECIES: AIPR family protein [unclassified Streptomyces]WKX17127.1 AIPR family protein [Streptomyces sp. HUAS CX7]
MTTQLELHQMRSALTQAYQGLIDESDLKRNSDKERERAFLSRAVAATAIRRVTGWELKRCAEAVIDGSDDNGIDAVAVADGSQVWLVQAKWSEKGTAGFHTDAARSLIDGLRLLENRQFDVFNKKLQPFTALLDSALGDPNLKINLVIALVGNDPLHSHTTAILDRAREDHHGHGPMLSYDLLTTTELLQQLREDRMPDPVDVTLRMLKWLRRDLPFPSYQGSLRARNVGDMYERHGSHLFSKNIRQSLGLTRINVGIEKTLAEEPENFWYFNNGITILCDRIEPFYPGRRHPDHPVDLKLTHATVVNGAQTVTSIHKAMQEMPEAATEAEVAVRVIALNEDYADYASRIAETTNTQNDVYRRDFISLDENQARIREDFDLTLGKAYVYKRGEIEPVPGSGCSVVQAAVALACAHRTPTLAVRAKRDTELLWEPGPQGAYQRLFGEVPSALRIWRCVQILLETGRILHALRDQLEGRTHNVARHGDILITHLVIQLLDLTEIDELTFPIESTLAAIPELIEAILPSLAYRVDIMYGPNAFLMSTFTDEGRCEPLAKMVVDDVRSGTPMPQLPYGHGELARPKRHQRPGAVPTLISARVIKDGTPLTYAPSNAPEELATGEWLTADERRAKARWQNHRTRPLIWSYDGLAYSPSGLVLRIWELAGWAEAPVAVQGTARWKVDGDRTLNEVATAWLALEEEQG